MLARNRLSISLSNVRRTIQLLSPSSSSPPHPLNQQQYRSFYHRHHLFPLWNLTVKQRVHDGLKIINPSYTLSSSSSSFSDDDCHYKYRYKYLYSDISNVNYNKSLHYRALTRNRTRFTGMKTRRSLTTNSTTTTTTSTTSTSPTTTSTTRTTTIPLPSAVNNDNISSSNNTTCSRIQSDSNIYATSDQKNIDAVETNDLLQPTPKDTPVVVAAASAAADAIASAATIDLIVNETEGMIETDTTDSRSTSSTTSMKRRRRYRRRHRLLGVRTLRKPLYTVSKGRFINRISRPAGTTRRMPLPTMSSKSIGQRGWDASFRVYVNFVQQSKGIQQIIRQRQQQQQGKKMQQRRQVNGVDDLTVLQINDANSSINSNININAIVENHNQNCNSYSGGNNTTSFRPNKNTIKLRNMLPKKDPRLRRWIVRMRAEYQKKIDGQPSMITDEREELLRNNGFSLFMCSVSVPWEKRFDQLVQFLKKNDGLYPHEIKESLNDEEMDLYHWCNRQRTLRKAYVQAGNKNRDPRKLSTIHINDERIQRLDELNFLWSVQELQWHERYVELQQYYKHHGNCMVPRSYVSNASLARWVETQRRKYALLKEGKPTPLTKERIDLLNEMGFEWDGYEVKWIERCNDLIKYQELNGENALPTHKTDRSLYRWIVSQRKMYHKWMNGEPSKMNEHRRDRLEALGVDWTMKESKPKMISRKVQMIK